MNPSNAISKLKLEVNQPQVISFTSPRGIPCKSKFAGDQIMWTLSDGRRYYGDPYLQERIDALRLQPMQQFEIEKIETFIGNCRDSEVVVRPVGAPARGTTTVRKAPAAAITSQAVSQIPDSAAEYESELQRALKNAIEACANAEMYAKSIDYDCRFSPEQVKCMAISVLIGMQQARR